ncbi:hypothetical protein CBR_g32310 [Chara braunii]|uniref:Histone-lysine N-methyltransferase n=1 Tax=Chara braunii TaxID=69332 RepID=A0A388JND5_CHABU|nr:hypothetical protein CBR_g32310 [Chara braunii]|eukprot:GBG59297.1 hypothetical protein CBR_g32310 [Chara braunii]
MATSVGGRSGVFTPPAGAVIVDLDSDDDEEVREVGPENWTEQQTRRLSLPLASEREGTRSRVSPSPYHAVDQQASQHWETISASNGGRRSRLLASPSPSAPLSPPRRGVVSSSPTCMERHVSDGGGLHSEVLSSRVRSCRGFAADSPRLPVPVRGEPNETTGLVSPRATCPTEIHLFCLPFSASPFPSPPRPLPALPSTTLALALCNGSSDSPSTSSCRQRQEGSSEGDGERGGGEEEEAGGREQEAEEGGRGQEAEEGGREQEEGVGGDAENDHGGGQSSEHDDMDLVEIEEEDWRRSSKRAKSGGAVVIEEGKRERRGLSISPPLSRALSPHPVRVRARPLRNGQQRPEEGERDSPHPSGCVRPPPRGSASAATPRSSYQRLMALAHHRPRQPVGSPRRLGGKGHVTITYLSDGEDRGAQYYSGKECPSSSSPSPGASLRCLAREEDDAGPSDDTLPAAHSLSSTYHASGGTSAAHRGYGGSEAMPTAPRRTKHAGVHSPSAAKRAVLVGDDSEGKRDREKGVEVMGRDDDPEERSRERGGEEDAERRTVAGNGVEQGGRAERPGNRKWGKRKLRREGLVLRRSPRVELQMGLAAKAAAEDTRAAASGRACASEMSPPGGENGRSGGGDGNHVHLIKRSSVNANELVRHWEGGRVLDLTRLDESEARRFVKQTLRHFNALFLRFSQMEASRPDLKAFSEMRHIGAVVNRNPKGPIVGPVPGVKPGDRFYARCEMCVVGLHPNWMNGIGTGVVRITNQQGVQDDVTLALAVVMSGGYEDDLDNGEELVYTGEGGNDITGGRCQLKDQDPNSKGNKGLRNSMELRKPVRLVRGHSSPNTFTKRVYTYDGLYEVVSTWEEVGISGFRVIKFKLHRLPAQPPLTTDLVEFKPKSVKFTPAGVVCEDIADGLERRKIVAVNTFDDPPVPPPPFQYITKRIELAGLVPHVRQKGCSCKDKCTNAELCECARKNGGTFPYVKIGGPRLVKARSVVYECGPNCSCGPECLNRTTQQGLQFRFEVFKTENKGWGLRSWDSIPAGSFVCEYAGRVLKDTDGEKVDCDEYLFDLDLLRIMKYSAQSRWGDVPTIDETDEHAAKLLSDRYDDNVDFCMDASKVGNVSRFANHSCSPNMFVQCVLHDHHDLELPHICLFAGEHIPALHELTYDYAYEVNSVLQPDGTHRHRNCYCGAPDCRGVLY